MPTINQLVKEKRTKVSRRSKAVALGRGFNSIKNRPFTIRRHSSAGCALKLRPQLEKPNSALRGNSSRQVD